MGNKTLQRILVTVFGLAFVGSTGAAVIAGFFNNGNTTTTNTNNSVESPSIEEQIQIRVSGYEKVLAREPKNITALTGLAEIYLQTGNLEKAIPPLEQLVKSYPERKEFAALLAEIKQEKTKNETTK